ncbi:11707_t:CDS:2 [Entrophospora sp. SA101]|nr:11707_t:CDS:2 [Entrophospora sp. SA101]
MKETIKPITDEYIDKEVFENESHIDTNILNELDVNEPGLEIEEPLTKALQYLSISSFFLNLEKD